jgi:TRAP-type transport system small permease protein
MSSASNGHGDSPGPRSLRIEQAVMALAMALLCVITLANVAVRYFTNISFAFTEEISVWLMVVMALVGTSNALARRHHIAVTLLVERAAPGFRKALDLFGLLATATMFGVLAWYGTRFAWDDFRYDVTSPALGIPQWLYTVWLPLLALLIAGRALQYAWLRFGSGD